MNHKRLGPMRATELTDRLDHIDNQLVQLIGLVQKLAVRKDGDVVASEVLLEASHRWMTRGNGKG